MGSAPETDLLDERHQRAAVAGQRVLDGRRGCDSRLAWFVITNLTPDSWRYEQSFSDDGGKTWEVNWIAIDTRLDPK